MSSSDTDHLLTFLAAGREFEHDGHTWRIVEVQHGGTIIAQHSPELVGEDTRRHFTFDVLIGQSVWAQDERLAATKRDAADKLRSVPAREVPRGPGEWHPTVRTVDYIMAATSMSEVEALAHLEVTAAGQVEQPMVVYGDAFAEDSERGREYRRYLLQRIRARQS